MTRATKVLGSITVMLLTWLLVLYNVISLPLSDTIRYNILPLLPIYCIILFGCYSLLVIGYSIYNFNDVDYAVNELNNDIDNARKRLVQKGFKFQ